MKNKSTEQDQLRQAAEAKLSYEPDSKLMPPRSEKLLHELRVHQIELEMQNEKLQESQVELEKSRDRFVDFYDFAPVGYITLNKVGMIDDINLTGAAMLGVARNKLPYHRFASYVATKDQDRWHHHLLSVLKDDNKHSCELELQPVNKPSICALLDCLRLKNSVNEYFVRIALTDITERKRAEEALRSDEEFFRLIVENVDDYLAVLDLEGRRLFTSPSYAKLFGSLEALKNSDSFAEIHPDDRERVKLVFNETVRAGRSQRLNFRFVLADGSIRYMESCGALIRSSEGKPLRVVVVSRDITDRLNFDEEIRKLAFNDTLTHLPNRRLLIDRLKQAMSANKRSGLFGALLFLDLDNFKPLNDAYGHDAGDLLLVDAARRITNCVREMDTVARFGGDEFVVLLSELDMDRSTSATEAGVVAEKIRAALAEPYIFKAEEGSGATIEHRCTSSIGVALFHNHETSAENILKLADMAMYQSKDSGRNAIRFYDSIA